MPFNFLQLNRRSGKGKIFASLVSFLLASVLVAIPASAAAPSIISYQGRLTNSSGQLLGESGTSYVFRFSIWDNATVAAGSQLWPASSATPGNATTTVTEGVFNVNIGDTSNGTDALTYNFNDDDEVYLQVEVSTNGTSFETLSLRQRITSSGYAINTNTVGGYSAAQSASDNQIPVLTNGNLVLGDTNPQINASGANTLTLQGGGLSGDIQFFSSSNRLTSAGNLVIAGGFTGNSATTTDTLNVGGTLAVATTTSQGWDLQINNAAIFGGNITGLASASFNSLQVTTLNNANCDLKADSSGNFYCGSDSVGSGGGSGIGWTWNTAALLSMVTTTDDLLLGANATTSPAKLSVYNTSDQGGIVVKAHSSQNKNLFETQNNSGSFLSGFTADGGLLLNTASTTAIRVQNGSGVDKFLVNAVTGNATATSLVVGTANYPTINLQAGDIWAGRATTTNLAVSGIASGDIVLGGGTTSGLYATSTLSVIKGGTGLQSAA
ncbi:MAG: hypothetical protein AAB871_02970, partial [Patescibacteria group bacterium]